MPCALGGPAGPGGAYALDVVDDAREADAHEPEEEERHEQRGEGALERVGQHRRTLVVPYHLEQPQQPQQPACSPQPTQLRGARDRHPGRGWVPGCVGAWVLRSALPRHSGSVSDSPTFPPALTVICQ